MIFLDTLDRVDHVSDPVISILEIPKGWNHAFHSYNNFSRSKENQSQKEKIYRVPVDNL